MLRVNGSTPISVGPYTFRPNVDYTEGFGIDQVDSTLGAVQLAIANGLLIDTTPPVTNDGTATLAGLSTTSLSTTSQFNIQSSVIDGITTYSMYNKNTIVNDANLEPKGSFFESTYTGAGGPTLPATLWANLTYNQSGPVTTGHGGAIFGRVIGTQTVQGFSFGVEGNAWGTSAQTSANVVGVIGHAVWRGPASLTPTANIIGVNSRSEVTLENDLSTPRAVGTVIAFRGETYGGTPGMKYAFYSPLVDDQVISFGNVRRIPPTAQVLVNDGTILDNGAGGIKRISSASDIRTGLTNTFTTPSQTADGTDNIGSWMDVFNTGSFTVTLKSNTAFKTYGNLDIDLPSGAVVRVLCDGTQWRQASQPVYVSGSEVYAQAYSGIISAGTSGQFANATSISLPAGNWEIAVVCEVSANGATVTEAIVAASIFSGNTTTDHAIGDNRVSMAVPTATNFAGGTIAGWRKALTTTTTIYAKVRLTYSAATPQVVVRISAWRR